ncbi:hypothetical protein BH09VER1_BH09VER1_18730 [soil metagenome]
MSADHYNWLPSFLFSGLGREVNTVYFFRPELVSREEKATFDITAKFHRRGEKNPRVREFKDVGFHSDWTLDVRDVFPEYAEVEEEYIYSELFASSSNLVPNIYNQSLTFFGQQTSTDGRLAGYLATNNIWGAPRRVYREKYFCDTFPGAKIDDDIALKIFMVNPFARSCQARATVYHSDGRSFASPWISIGEKCVETLVVDQQITQGNRGLFGVMLEAETKLASFYSTISLNSGQMLGIDHGHPYLLDVLAH